MNPTSKQVRAMTARLRTVLPMATREGHLDMNMPEVNKEKNLCGTTHCHGGWYAIACNLHNKRKCDYVDGANRIAKDLGFTPNKKVKAKEINELVEDWAADNPDIWGNKSGAYMFCDKIAFSHPIERPYGALTLLDVINHWDEVATRLEALEAPQYPDITKSLAEGMFIGDQTDLINVKTLI